MTYICTRIASDGTLKPAEVLRAAKEKGLYAFALTDHDTVAGIPPILHSGELTGIHFMPGIELSCEAEKHEYSAYWAIILISVMRTY